MTPNFLGDLRRFLGEGTLSPSSVQPQVRALNQAAREAYLAGDYDGAFGLFAQAQGIAAMTTAPSFFSDDFAFTNQVLSGSGTASADARAGVTLEVKGTQNAKPDSVLAAAGSGFREGLGQGVNDLSSAFKNFFSAQTLTIGAVLLVALYAVTRVTR